LIKRTGCLFCTEHPLRKLTGTWTDGLVPGRRPAA
jgi:hypothetical protein